MAQSLKNERMSEIWCYSKDQAWKKRPGMGEGGILQDMHATYSTIWFELCEYLHIMSTDDAEHRLEASLKFFLSPQMYLDQYSKRAPISRPS